jgi:8-oxo-dGTP diphosphatase
MNDWQKSDWASWVPKERATLVFVVRAGRILLIEKKRGLGAGKINGPGGRIDPGESPLQCAIREVQEELLVTPLGLSEAGRLMFQFVDGHSIDCHVFVATEVDGEPRETAEATPVWTDVNEIPYERMWEDDRHWLPNLLRGERFIGRFVFEGDRMLWHDVRPAVEF